MTEDTKAQSELADLVGQLTKKAEDDPAAREALAALAEGIAPADQSDIRLAPEVPSFAKVLWDEYQRHLTENTTFTGFNF